MAIEIDSIEKFIKLRNGDYGFGSSEELLEVTLTKDLDFFLYEDRSYSLPINSNTFYMNFDGQNHRIDNIYTYEEIGNPSSEYGVIAGVLAAGCIKNLTIAHANITTYTVSPITQSNITGGIVATLAGGTIQNCHFTGIIEAVDGYASSIACIVQPSTDGKPSIDRCTSTCTIKSGTKDACMFGVCGGNGIVSNCHHIGDVYAGINSMAFGRQMKTVLNCVFQGALIASSKFHPMCSNGNLYNSIAVIKSGTTGTCEDIGTSRVFNSYYDSTVASSAGITVNHLIAATTTELKGRDWMNNHGLPCVTI